VVKVSKLLYAIASRHRHRIASPSHRIARTLTPIR
jgi:hypothetical protein